MPGEITTHHFVAGEVCSFPVTIIDMVNETHSRTFPDGSSLSTGRLVERITNDETGEDTVRNISGPGASTYGPNGEWTLTLTGSSIFWIIKEIGDATGTLNEGLFIGHGPLVYVDLQLVQAPPHYENLCETLELTRSTGSVTVVVVRAGGRRPGDGPGAAGTPTRRPARPRPRPGRA